MRCRRSGAPSGSPFQSILRRIPIAIAPRFGGLAIAAYGVVGGVHLGLALTLALAALTLVAIQRVDIPAVLDEVPANAVGVWRALPSSLRWLLTSDIAIRTGPRPPSQSPRAIQVAAGPLDIL